MSTVPTATVEGALCRLNNGRLEYQMRVGAMLKFDAWYRENDGNTFETIWAQSIEAAREKSRSILPQKRVTIEPEYTTDPIASGWSLEAKKQADDWRDDLIATARIAAKFAPTREAAE